MAATAPAMSARVIRRLRITLPDGWSDQMDLERALATLSPTARAVVWLYDVEGYSHEEIARQFGRTVSFSKSQLARAHARLREWYEPQKDGQPCAPRRESFHPSAPAAGRAATSPGSFANCLPRPSPAL